MRKRKSVFPWLLLIYALVLSAVMVFACKFVWEWLEDYQLRYDTAKHQTSEEVYMDNLLSQVNEDYITQALQNYPQHEYVTEHSWSLQQHVDYFTALAEKELHYQQNENYKSDAPIYDLCSGDIRIAAVSLAHGKQTDGFGFRNWQTKAVVFDTNEIQYQDYTIELQSTMQLRLDGSPAPESYCTFTGTVLDIPALEQTARYDVAKVAVDKGGELPATSTYYLPHCIALPDVYVLDSMGAPVDTSYTEGNTLRYLKDNASMSFAESVEQRVLDTCDTYIRNIYRKTSFNNVSKYLVYNSQAYKVIKDVQSSIAWGWNPDVVKVLNCEVYDVERYSDSLFACSYEATVHKSDEKQQEEETFRYRMLFTEDDGTWYLTYFILQN